MESGIKLTLVYRLLPNGFHKLLFLQDPHDHRRSSELYFQMLIHLLLLFLLYTTNMILYHQRLRVIKRPY